MKICGNPDWLHSMLPSFDCPREAHRPTAIVIDHKLLVSESHAAFDAMDAFWRSISVPVQVQRLVDARVIWINQSWFRRQQIDVSDLATRGAVEKWLLDTFAFVIRQQSDQPALFDSEAAVFYADRYGGRGIGNAGGSGRCGYVDGFYVKGIGPTPLVDPSGPFFHTHGALTLEEAIREVVLSEVAGAELPHGAIPTLAVIAIKQRLHHSAKDEDGEPRALLIRPAFVRGGHFECATSFVGATGSQFHKEGDAARVRAAVRLLPVEKAALTPHPSQANSLNEFAARMAAQIAFGRVHRLFHGSYISSNLGVNGALADFGSFRALPNWEGAHVVNGMPSFGKEWAAFISTVIMSFGFHVRQYSEGAARSGAHVSTMDTIRDAETIFERTLLQEGLALFGLEDQEVHAAHLSLALRTYFSRQNSRLRDYYQEDVQQNPGPWLWDDLFGARGAVARQTDEGRAAQSVIDALWMLSADPRDQQHIMLTAKRTLKPRDGLARETLQVWIYNNFIYGKNHDYWLTAHIDEEIALRICEGRRLWKLHGGRMTVKGQAMSADCSALWVLDRNRGKDRVYLRCVVVNGGSRVFGQHVPRESLLAVAQHVDGADWDLVCDVANGYEGGATSVMLGRTLVRLPEMQVRYS